MLGSNVNAQESSPFCKIPWEVLDLVWKDLSTASRVVLMLTCKHFAKIGKLRHTEMPPTDDFKYYWILSRMASWMPRGLKLCGKCRMYRVTVSEQYKETDWRLMWLQEDWEACAKRTDEMFICPLHRINYNALCKLPEVEGELKPFPAPCQKARLPADGTGGLHPKLHYRLDFVARTHPTKQALKVYNAGVKRRRSF
jgi:hypothetical protein